MIRVGPIVGCFVELSLWNEAKWNDEVTNEKLDLNASQSTMTAAHDTAQSQKPSRMSSIQQDGVFVFICAVLFFPVWLASFYKSDAARGVTSPLHD